MGILKNRTFAIALSVILCLLFALLGMNRSVAKEAEKYSAGFYDGVYVKEGDYTSASIYSILKSCCNHSLTLASVFADCPGVTDEAAALTEARRALIDAMESEDISDMYGANYMVTATAEALMDAAGGAEISDSDRSKAADAYEKLTGAEAAISKNPYNDSLSEFYAKVMGTLPVRLGRWAIFASGPEGFAFKEL